MATEFLAKNSEHWREWLDQHHQDCTEVWLVFYKKHTGKQGLGYRQAVNEALCYGWIDGMKRRLDEERYAYRFTPRKPRSKWSDLNIKLAEELIASGRMMANGMAAFEARIEYDSEFLKQKARSDMALSTDIEAELKTHEAAWQNFNNLAAGYRRQYVNWLMTAKKPETRRKRLDEAIRLLNENARLGMK